MWTALLCVALIPPAQKGPQIEPRLGEVRLAVGAEELAPVGARAGVYDQSTSDAWQVEIGEESISFEALDGDPPARSLPSKSSFMRCLAISADTAWLVDAQAEKPTLYRLQLELGEWQPEWTLDDKALRVPVKSGLRSRVSCVLPHAGMLYVVRRDELVDGPLWTGTSSVVVARLNAGSGKAIWARRFECEMPSERPGAVLMAPMLTGPANEWPIELQFFEEGLLACAQGSQGLMLLDPKTGKTQWNIDRLWEYQRGYTGPSVWAHFVGRFRMRDSEIERPAVQTKEGKAYHDELEQIFEQRRAAFREHYQGSFVAGPFVVREQNASEEYPSPRLLVVTSVTPRDRWSGQLSQQVVYEIDPFPQQPCSMVPLPRNALGWAAAVDGDRLTLACAGGGWASLSTSLNGKHAAPGSAPDGIAEIVWYRDHATPERSAWMICGPARDAVDVDAALGVRAAGGGWIESEGDALFHFPLWLVDTKSGDAREAELLVPFEGRIEVHESDRVRRGEPIRTWGWRGLALTTLWLRHGKLHVWLTNGAQTWRVDFDAAALAAAK